MRGDSSNPGATGSPPPAGAIRRVLAGLPSALADLLTAGICIATWWAPEALPDDLLRVTALIMLIEFLSIHGLIMLPLIVVIMADRWPRAALPLGVLLYLSFAVGASVVLQTWWPTLFFAWLLLSRYVLPRWNIGGADESLDPGKLWFVSTMLWIGLVFATVLLPVPALGWDAEAIARLGLPGEGIWVDEPHRLLAFAAIYFTLLAVFKLSASPTPAGRKDRRTQSSKRQSLRRAGGDG